VVGGFPRQLRERLDGEKPGNFVAQVVTEGDANEGVNDALLIHGGGMKRNERIDVESASSAEGCRVEESPYG
jgi:hypothetical protein